MDTEKNLNHENAIYEKKNKFFKIKKFISTSRVQFRKIFLFKPLNFLTLITFFPFAFGFSQFVYKKAIQQNSAQVFNQNLPALRVLKPKLNFETFEYISKSNSLALDQTHFQKLFSGTTFNGNFMFGQPKYIAKIRKPEKLNNEQFNGLDLNFYTLKSCLFTTSIENLEKNFDELPSVLESQPKFENGILGELSDLTFFPQLELGQKTKNLSSNPKVKFTSTKSVLSKLSSGENSLSLVNSVPLCFKNFSDDLRGDLEKTKAGLEFPWSNLDFKSFSQIDETFLLEKLLHDLKYQKKVPSETSDSRLMSGYMYPDMSFFDLKWLSLQKTFTKKDVFQNFRIEHPHLACFSKIYNFKISSLPTPEILLEKSRLKNSDSNKEVFIGPTLILESQIASDWDAFDWETLAPSPSPASPFGDENNLRSWFHSYLSPYNSLFRFKTNFFGVYESPEFAKTTEKGETCRSLFREQSSPDTIDFSVDIVPRRGSFSTFRSYLFVPHEISQTFGVRGLNIPPDSSTPGDVTQDELQNTQEVFLPVIEIQQPEFRSLKQSPALFTPLPTSFDRGLLGNVDYTVSTMNPNLEQNLSSGKYLKISSIFSQSSQNLLENWEPLTTSSWLVISKLSFAVLFFQVLRGLLDNYGRELLAYLLELVSAGGFLDDSLKQEIEILMGQREKGFRIIPKSRKKFTDIVGIEKLLPEVYEIVWYLRNSARQFTRSQTIPRGVLLTGPPGTGKTLLVQAIAGEAGVPVVASSGSSLLEPGESGAIKLEILFREARQLAPCIVFIDEIDTLAQKRTGVIEHLMDPDDDSLELLNPSLVKYGSMLDYPVQEKQPQSEIQTQQFQPSLKQDQLALLMQLLIELDGIQGRDNVLVIGATNRPEVLDPAVLRPGRFDKILQVGLPGEEKRIEILKFYGQSLGYHSPIEWTYLAQRTEGFTAADLATLMNESSFKAILNQTAHTIETIEHGIDRVTTSQSEKFTVVKTGSTATVSKVSLLRFAYYQAGKVVVTQILKTHPNILFASLWPRKTTARSIQISTNLQNLILQFSTLVELTERLVGSYAGKGAEVVFFQSYSQNGSNLSTLGLDELQFAQKLISCLLENWHFYSKKFSIQKTITLSSNINSREFKKKKEKIELYSSFLQTHETPPMKEALKRNRSSLVRDDEDIYSLYDAQISYSLPWWQENISYELGLTEKKYRKWTRFYLYNPERNLRNAEWFPPEEFFHSISALKNLKTAFLNVSKLETKGKLAQTARALPDEKEISDDTELTKESKSTQKENPRKASESRKNHFTWNQLAKINRDYLVHSLSLQAFNKTLLILNENRELVDRIVIELLYQEILRQPDLEKLFTNFQKIKKQKPSTTISRENSFYVLEPSWGPNSRKKFPRWVDFVDVDPDFSGQ